ncbi:SH3 beta-barrel fold-containing protein [Bacteroides sp.]
MKKLKRPTSEGEAMREKWEKRITQEKDYRKSTAQWMAQRLEALLDYMLYGHAVIAFYKQDGKFKFVRATLIYYEEEFHKKYNPANVRGTVVYWDMDEQGWRSFQIENFLEWRTIV